MTKSQKIAYTAIFTALGIILNVATFPKIEGIGTVSFVYLISYLSAVFLGSWYGFIAIALADIFGAIIRPIGPYNPLITLSNALMPLIVAMSWKYLTTLPAYVRLLIGAIISFVICTLILTPLALIMLGFFGGEFSNAVIFQATFQPFWIALNLILTILVIAALKRIPSLTDKLTAPIKTLK